MMPLLFFFFQFTLTDFWGGLNTIADNNNNNSLTMSIAPTKKKKKGINLKLKQITGQRRVDGSGRVALGARKTCVIPGVREIGQS